LAIHLDLIHDTFEDPSVTAIQGKRDFVVIFMGPAVKFNRIAMHHDSLEF
jgi:hypothetical protein